MNTGRGFIATFVTLAVGSCGLVAGLPAQQAENLPDDVTERYIDGLKRAGMPSWSLACAADLLAARDGFTKSVDDAEVLKSVAESDHLCSLDAEVDLLATSLLALEEPAGALALYNAWYDKDQCLRTPAAVLLKAQAHRLLAWHLMDPPPGRVSSDVVPDRMALFERANVELARAWQLLASHTGELSRHGQAKTETLHKWLTSGLPKPRLLTEVFGDDGRGVPTLPDSVPRQKLPAFQGIDYATAYLLWEARTLRELGDLTFRETGSSISFASAGTGTQQSTSLAYYSVARDSLYLARLIDSTDQEAEYEATLLKKRIDWIRAGKGFNDIDFFRFDRYQRDTYVPASLGELRTHLDRLREMRDAESIRVADQMSWIGNLQQSSADRELLARAFQADARRQIQFRIADLEHMLNQIQNGADRASLELLESDIDRLVAEFGNELQSVQYTGDLERLRLQLLSAMLDSVQALTRLGGRSELALAADQSIDESNEYAASEDYLAITQFVNAMPEVGEADRQLKRAWESFQSPSRVGTTTLDDMILAARSADLERQRRQRDLDLYDKRFELADVTEELRSVQVNLDNVSQELKSALDKFRRDQDAALDETEKQLIAAHVVPRMQDQVSRFAERAHQAVAFVRDAQEKLQQVREVITKIKETRQKVEEAYDKIVGVIESAKKIPKVHTAGLASGTTLDAGDAIASSAQAILDKLVAMYEGKIDTAALDRQVDSATAVVQARLQEAQEAERLLREETTKLNVQVALLAETAKFQPGGMYHTKYQERTRQLEEERQRQQQKVTELESKQQSLDKWIAGYERDQLMDYLEQARNEAQQAWGRVAHAYLQRDHLLQGVRIHIERLEQQQREASAARALIANYRDTIATKKIAAQERRGEVQDEVMRRDEILIAKIQAALAGLQAELATMDRPVKRVVTADLIQSLAPALARAGNRIDPAEIVQAKDAANTVVARIARWLYVLGDPEAIALGSPCQSIREFELAEQALRERWGALRARYGGTRHKVLVLTIDDPEVLAGVMTSHRLLLQTVAAWPLTMETDPVAVSKESEFYLADRNVWHYRNPQMTRGGAARFYLTRSAAETDGAGILSGGWLLCRWKNPMGEEVTSPGPYLIPTLYRQGPIKVRWNGTVRSMPVKFDYNFGVNPLVQDDFSKVDNFKSFIDELPRDIEDHLERPYLGQNHDHLFGLGLDNRWVFEVQDRRPSRHDLAQPAALKQIDIVLTYLFPTQESERRSHPAQEFTSTREFPTPDLAFLGEGGTTAPEPDVLTRILNKLEHPNEDPDLEHVLDQERVAGDKLKQALVAAVKADINNVLVGVDNATAPEGQDAATELGQTLPDATVAILQPVAVHDRLAAAVNLLRVLKGALQSEYVDPLRAANDQLEGLGHTVEGVKRLGIPLMEESTKPVYCLDQLTADLERVYHLYQQLDTYERELSSVLEAYQSVVLDDNDRQALDALLNEPVPRYVWMSRVAKQFHGKAKEEQAAAEFVLRRLVEWRTDPSETQKLWP